VSHDEEDGASQFHPDGYTPMGEAAMITLPELVALDESLRALASLPLGWRASRESRSAAWVLSKGDSS
jgi:hypothetical protein